MKTTYSLLTFIRAFEKASAGKDTLQTFDDFLTLCLFHLTKKPFCSVYYNECSRILETYKQVGSFGDFVMLPSIFCKLGADQTRPDMIGEFYMSVIAPQARKAILSPFPLCMEITQLFIREAIRSTCILDTSVGTGRMLLAFERNKTKKHRYHGIDTDPVLAKLAGVNMFLHGLEGEVICADESDPDKFKIGYKVSFDDPKTGIFRFEEKEYSEICFMFNKLSAETKTQRPKKRVLFL